MASVSNALNPCARSVNQLTMMYASPVTPATLFSMVNAKPAKSTVFLVRLMELHAWSARSPTFYRKGYARSAQEDASNAASTQISARCASQATSSTMRQTYAIDAKWAALCAKMGFAIRLRGDGWIALGS